MIRRLVANDSASSDLDFLREIAATDLLPTYIPSWLDPSSYANPVWTVTLEGGYALKLNFAVPLYDGSLLTDVKHAGTLGVMKMWVASQDLVNPITGVTLSPNTVKRRIAWVVQLCDYFILNGERFQLAEHGFSAITSADIYQLVRDLADSASVGDSIYKWKEHLSDFLVRVGRDVSIAQIKEVMSSQPEIGRFSSTPGEWILSLTSHQLLRARVWLSLNSFYVKGTGDGFDRVPAIDRLVAAALPQTIALRRIATLPLELCYSVNNSFRREFAAVPAQTSIGGRSTQRGLSRHLGRLHELAAISASECAGLAASIRSVVANHEFFRQTNFRPDGRFATFPKGAVFPMLSGALEFVEVNGDCLIDAFLSVARYMTASAGGTRGTLGTLNVVEHISPRLRTLGISRWSIDLTDKGQIQTSDADYFSDLRANVGLHELLLVYVGATIVATGLLSARRIGELADLVAGSCLDSTNSWLCFDGRKSGPLGLREQMLRPVPQVVGRALGRLERLQRGLIELGVLSSYTKVLSIPRLDASGLRLVHYNSLYGAVDLFCDYIATAVDKSARRYYYRQHIGRRFFVLLFFWGSTKNGGMDTLRWFVGHTDVEHLWHYISESTPGAVMRQSMAQFAAEEACEGAPEAAGLRQLLEAKFGIKHFSVSMADEIHEYVESLVDEGEVQVEPVFFTSPSGRNYKILITVSQKGAAL
jgi:hypothetical protein